MTNTPQDDQTPTSTSDIPVKSSEEDADTEQTKERVEDTAEHSELAKEQMLSLKTLSLVMEMATSKSLDEQVANWDRLLAEWAQHVSKLEPSEGLDIVYQSALNAGGGAYYRRYEQKEQIEDLKQSIAVWQ